MAVDSSPRGIDDLHQLECVPASKTDPGYPSLPQRGEGAVCCGTEADPARGASQGRSELKNLGARPPPLEVTAYTQEIPCGNAPEAVPDAPTHVLVELGTGAREPDVYACDDPSACEAPAAGLLHDLNDGASSPGVDGDVCEGRRTAVDWESTEVGIRVVSTTSHLEIPKSEAGVPGSVVWGWSSECLDALDTHADSEFDCATILVLEATLLEYGAESGWAGALPFPCIAPPGW